MPWGPDRNYAHMGQFADGNRSSTRMAREDLPRDSNRWGQPNNGRRRSAQAIRTTEGFQVLLGVDDPADAERIFHALAENGTVQMPVQETFWAVRFGVLIDQFGVP